jgi:transcriptional regulator with XRE-family HTH domain
MVLKARLGPVENLEDAYIGARRFNRRELLLPTKGSLPDGEVANVAVHNISETGLLLETSEKMTAGETLSVDLPNAGSVEAEIVWVSGILYGCVFLDQVSEGVLDAAQLQADFQALEALASLKRGESLGPKLNRLRREQGMTLAQVASQLAVSKPTVWAWEKGKAKPIPERLEAIARVLGVEPVELTDTAPNEDAEPVIRESRERIAQIYGVHPEKVRIMIDL